MLFLNNTFRSGKKCYNAYSSLHMKPSGKIQIEACVSHISHTSSSLLTFLLSQVSCCYGGIVRVTILNYFSFFNQTLHLWINPSEKYWFSGCFHIWHIWSASNEPEFNSLVRAFCAGVKTLMQTPVRTKQSDQDQHFEVVSVRF